MKITFILPSVSLSGGIRVAVIYAQRLQQRGHEVLIVSSPKKPPTWREQLRSLRRGEGWISTKPEPSHLDNTTIPHHIIDCVRPVTDADIPDADAVIATWWETAHWVNNLSEQKGAKVYFIQHHETHDYFPQNLVSATYLMPLHKIVVARWLVEVMTTKYQDKHVSLVPNSVDTELFYASTRTKQPTPTFGMMYSTTQWKGSDIALEAFTRLIKKYPQAQLVAFGMVKPSPQLPLLPQTYFVHQPAQHQLKDLYARCDAWLFSSRVEGFGLPILEAMACRTPVIGTPVGAAPDLIDKGGGILVPAESPKDMAQAMEQIVRMPEKLWCAMSKTAYHTAQTYTWTDATRLFEAALKEAFERHQRKN